MVLRSYSAAKIALKGRLPTEGALTIWLHPEDDAEALAQFGPLVGGYLVLPDPSWFGVFDGPFDWGNDQPGTVAAEGTLWLGASEYSVPLTRTPVERPPAIFGQAVFGESRFGDARGSALWAFHGLDSPPPDDIVSRRAPRPSVTSQTVARTDSRGIRLSSIEVVERLTHEIEDAAVDAATKALMPALRASLDVLRTHIDDPGAGATAIGSLLVSLRALGESLKGIAGYAGIAKLGWELIKLVRDWNGT